MLSKWNYCLFLFQILQNDQSAKYIFIGIGKQTLSKWNLPFYSFLLEVLNDFLNISYSGGSKICFCDTHVKSALKKVGAVHINIWKRISGVIVIFELLLARLWRRTRSGRARSAYSPCGSPRTLTSPRAHTPMEDTRQPPEGRAAKR